MRPRWWRPSCAWPYLPGMTWLGDLAVPKLLGGISEVLGGSAPASPAPPPPSTPATPPPAPPNPGMPRPSGDPLDLLTPEQRAQLTYIGVDPTTAPLSDINRALTGLGERALASTPQQPAPTPAGPVDGLDGAAAEAAVRVDNALQRNHNAVNDADAQLTEAILRASASDQQGKARLQALQQSILDRSEEHTSELQSRPHLVCRLLLEKKKEKENTPVGRARDQQNNVHQLH